MRVLSTIIVIGFASMGIGAVTHPVGFWGVTDTAWYFGGALLVLIPLLAIFARKTGELAAEWNQAECVQWHASHTQCASCHRWMPSTEEMRWLQHRPMCVPCWRRSERVHLQIIVGGKDTT